MGDHDDVSDRSTDGQVDSDDTTQADAGMAGGSGAQAGESTVSPPATRPHADDEDLDDA